MRIELVIKSIGSIALLYVTFNNSILPLKEKSRQLFPKDTEINHQAVLKKLQEILAVRGKKVWCVFSLPTQHFSVG